MLGKRETLEINKDENSKSKKYAKLSVNDSIKDNKDIIAFKSNPSTFICSQYGSISINEDKNLISFGSNIFGWLGHEDINTIINPPKQIPNLMNIKMVDCGGEHVACIDYDGKLFTFGDNYFDQLGIGKDKDELSLTHIPQQIINIPPIDFISCGYRFTMCITNERRIYSFGNNSFCQLGIGNSNSYLSPQLIPDLHDIEFIACESSSTICKTNSNEYYSWGYNEFGQLGQGNNGESCNKPVKCLNWPDDIIDIKCGSLHTLLLTSTGYVYSFGDNMSLQLGFKDDFKTINIPTLIKDIPLIKRIECGNCFSHCFDVKDNLWVFGHNGLGQLGIGTTENTHKPTLNESLHDIIDISSKGNHTFVKTINNEIYAHGDNKYSQLAIATNEIRQLTPVQIFKDNEDIWATNITRSKQKSARK